MPAQGAVFIKDVSGNTALLDTSGRLQMTGSGLAVSTSGNVVAISGLYSTATLVSGAAGISGIGAVGLFIYDYSGAAWTAVGTMKSGAAIVNNAGIPTGGTVQTFLQTAMNVDNIGAAQYALQINAGIVGFEPVAGTYGRVRANVSGDGFRLRVSTEGRAPTYSVNATNITVSSGVAQNGPLLALFNYGSGTATPVYKVKSLFIENEPANPASGFPIQFDIVRINSFSGGGTLLSGVAMDTNDPAYSGTLAGPTIQKNANSGAALDAMYFRYNMNTAGLPSGSFLSGGLDLGAAETYVLNAAEQTTNLIAARMPDTKEIVIRSGYGFAVLQSSGTNYTQVSSGGFSFYINMIYSVEA